MPDVAPGRIGYGDRVRLADHVARSMRKRRGKHAIDWLKREGTITRCPFGDSAFVTWDDRKSPDQWPIKALSKI